MKWKETGANNVLQLRCLNYSDTKWAQTWEKINMAYNNTLNYSYTRKNGF